MGGWNLNVMQTHYLLAGLNPLTLMIVGGWPVPIPTCFDQFWRPNMMVVPENNLIDLLMPWKARFEAEVKQADAGGVHVPTSARGMLRLLPYLATVVIQDALELCGPDRNPKYRDNPVHKLLLSSDKFM